MEMEEKEEKKVKVKQARAGCTMRLECFFFVFIVFGGFSFMLTDGHTNGRTDLHVDMRGRI